jgi:PAS domain S-box-containing protein
MVRTSHEGSGKRILVVEDGLIMARDIERRLHAMGYGVAGLAQSGEEATRMVAHVKPDLVLMDVSLKGGMDGIQTALKIREVMDIPVVYVTAYSDDGTLARARATNPFGYVLKPFEEKELRTTIEMALYRHSLDRQLRESEQRYRMLSELTASYGYSLLVTAESNVVVEWVTEAFERLTGLPSNAIMRQEDYLHPDDVERPAQRIKKFLSGESVVQEYRIRLRDGSYQWVRDHAHPSPRKQGEPLRVTGSVQDITHSKTAEDLAEEGVRLRSNRDTAIGSHVLSAGRRVLMLLECGVSATAQKGDEVGDLAEHLRELVHIQSLVYAGGRGSSASFGKSVKSVVADAFRRAGAGRLTYTVEVGVVDAGQETLVDVLLILNELVMHSLEGGVPSGRKGTIEVSVRTDANGAIVLGVDDENPAGGKDLDAKKPKNPSMRFIQELVGGVNGRIEVLKGEGTAVRVRIPPASMGG